MAKTPQREGKAQRKLGLIGSALMLPLAFGACGEARGDTLEEVLTAAHRNNPDLEGARLAVRTAREDRMQARAAYLPSLDVTATYGARQLDIEQDTGGTPVTTSSDSEPATAGARLTQRLFTGGRRGAQMALSRAGVENARHELRATEQEVLAATVEAYVGVRRDAEIVRLREDYVAGLEEQRSGTQRRLDVGAVTRTDLAQAEARLAGARASLSTARANLEAARARFVEIVGVAPDNLAPTAMPAQLPASLDEAVRLAETSHPLLGQAYEAQRAARARVGIERSSLLPQLSLVGRYDHNEDEIFIDETRESASALLELSIPLFEGGYSWSRTRQSRLNVRRAEVQHEGVRRAVVAQVVAAWNAVQSSRVVLAAAGEQVSAAEAAVRGARREQGIGLRSTIDVLDTERDWQEASIALARAQADAVVAGYALLAATGQLSLEGLGLAQPAQER